MSRLIGAETDGSLISSTHLKFSVSGESISLASAVLLTLVPIIPGSRTLWVCYS